MTSRPVCGAVLRHVHGETTCILTSGHLARNEEHAGWCEPCRAEGYDDPSDRLIWDRDGEDWTAPTPTPTRRPR